MSQQDNQQPAEPQPKAVNEGVTVELNKKALTNLAGYLDVLIEMDLELKRKEQFDERCNED